MTAAGRANTRPFVKVLRAYEQLMGEEFPAAFYFIAATIGLPRPK